MVKNILIIVAIAVVIFLLWKGCQNSKSENEAYNKIEKKLQGQIDANVKLKEDSAKLANENSDLLLSREELRADRDMIQGALIDESDENLKLSNALKKAKADKDTQLVFLYVDTIGVSNEMLRNRIKQLVVAYKKEKDNDSLLLENSKSQTRLYKNSYDSCLDAVKFTVTELPKIKPKSKIYFDLTGQVGAITAFGGGLGYMDASGRMISANYLISGHGAIYQLRLSAPLSLRRK